MRRRRKYQGSYHHHRSEHGAEEGREYHLPPASRGTISLPPSLQSILSDLLVLSGQLLCLSGQLENTNSSPSTFQLPWAADRGVVRRKSGESPSPKRPPPLGTSFLLHTAGVRAWHLDPVFPSLYPDPLPPPISLISFSKPHKLFGP